MVNNPNAPPSRRGERDIRHSVRRGSFIESERRASPRSRTVSIGLDVADYAIGAAQYAAECNSKQSRWRGSFPVAYSTPTNMNNAEPDVRNPGELRQRAYSSYFPSSISNHFGIATEDGNFPRRGLPGFASSPSHEQPSYSDLHRSSSLSSLANYQPSELSHSRSFQSSLSELTDTRKSSSRFGVRAHTGPSDKNVQNIISPLSRDRVDSPMGNRGASAISPTSDTRHTHSAYKHNDSHHQRVSGSVMKTMLSDYSEETIDSSPEKFFNSEDFSILIDSLSAEDTSTPSSQPTFEQSVDNLSPHESIAPPTRTPKDRTNVGQQASGYPLGSQSSPPTSTVLHMLRGPLVSDNELRNRTVSFESIDKTVLSCSEWIPKSGGTEARPPVGIGPSTTYPDGSPVDAASENTRMHRLTSLSSGTPMSSNATVYDTRSRPLYDNLSVRVDRSLSFNALVSSNSLSYFSNKYSDVQEGESHVSGASLSDGDSDDSDDDTASYTSDVGMAGVFEQDESEAENETQAAASTAALSIVTPTASSLLRQLPRVGDSTSSGEQKCTDEGNEDQVSQETDVSIPYDDVHSIERTKSPIVPPYTTTTPEVPAQMLSHAKDDKVDINNTSVSNVPEPRKGSMGAREPTSQEVSSPSSVSTRHTMSETELSATCSPTLCSSLAPVVAMVKQRRDKLVSSCRLAPELAPIFSVKRGERLWQRSKGANATNCRLCEKPFTLLRRKHHCRGCGALLCGNCTPFEPSIGTVLHNIGLTRMCVFCNALTHGRVLTALNIRVLLALQSDSTAFKPMDSIQVHQTGSDVLTMRVAMDDDGASNGRPSKSSGTSKSSKSSKGVKDGEYIRKGPPGTAKLYPPQSHMLGQTSGRPEIPNTIPTPVRHDPMDNVLNWFGAVVSGDLFEVKLRLACGQDPNEIDPSPGGEGYGALHMALFLLSGVVDAVESASYLAHAQSCLLRHSRQKESQPTAQSSPVMNTEQRPVPELPKYPSFHPSRFEPLTARQAYKLINPSGSGVPKELTNISTANMSFFSPVSLALRQAVYLRYIAGNTPESFHPHADVLSQLPFPYNLELPQQAVHTGGYTGTPRFAASASHSALPSPFGSPILRASGHSSQLPSPSLGPSMPASPVIFRSAAITSNITSPPSSTPATILSQMRSHPHHTGHMGPTTTTTTITTTTTSIPTITEDRPLDEEQWESQSPKRELFPDASVSDTKGVAPPVPPLSQPSVSSSAGRTTPRTPLLSPLITSLGSFVSAAATKLSGLSLGSSVDPAFATSPNKRNANNESFTTLSSPVFRGTPSKSRIAMPSPSPSLDAASFAIASNGYSSTSPVDLILQSPVLTALRANFERSAHAMVSTLLYGGADPNHAGFNGKTPLHLAAVHGNAEIVKCLLHCGAMENVQDKNELTPYDLALLRVQRAENVLYNEMVLMSALDPSDSPELPLVLPARKRNSVESTSVVSSELPSNRNSYRLEAMRLEVNTAKEVLELLNPQYATGTHDVFQETLSKASEFAALREKTAERIALRKDMFEEFVVSKRASPTTTDTLVREFEQEFATHNLDPPMSTPAVPSYGLPPLSLEEATLRKAQSLPIPATPILMNAGLSVLDPAAQSLQANLLAVQAKEHRMFAHSMYQSWQRDFLMDPLPHTPHEVRPEGRKISYMTFAFAACGLLSPRVSHIFDSEAEVDQFRLSLDNSYLKDDFISPGVFQQFPVDTSKKTVVYPPPILPMAASSLYSLLDPDWVARLPLIGRIWTKGHPKEIPGDVTDAIEEGFRHVQGDRYEVPIGLDFVYEYDSEEGSDMDDGASDNTESLVGDNSFVYTSTVEEFSQVKEVSPTRSEEDSVAMNSEVEEEVIAPEDLLHVKQCDSDDEEEVESPTVQDVDVTDTNSVMKSLRTAIMPSDDTDPVVVQCATVVNHTSAIVTDTPSTVPTHTRLPGKSQWQANVNCDTNPSKTSGTHGTTTTDLNDTGGTTPRPQPLDSVPDTYGTIVCKTRAVDHTDIATTGSTTDSMNSTDSATDTSTDGFHFASPHASSPAASHSTFASDPASIEFSHSRTPDVFVSPVILGHDSEWQSHSDSDTSLDTSQDARHTGGDYAAQQRELKRFRGILLRDTTDEVRGIDSMGIKNLRLSIPSASYTSPNLSEHDSGHDTDNEHDDDDDDDDDDGDEDEDADHEDPGGYTKTMTMGHDNEHEQYTSHPLLSRLERTTTGSSKNPSTEEDVATEGRTSLLSSASQGAPPQLVRIDNLEDTPARASSPTDPPQDTASLHRIGTNGKGTGVRRFAAMLSPISIPRLNSPSLTTKDTTDTCISVDSLLLHPIENTTPSTTSDPLHTAVSTSSLSLSDVETSHSTYGNMNLFTSDHSTPCPVPNEPVLERIYNSFETVNGNVIDEQRLSPIDEAGTGSDDTGSVQDREVISLDLSRSSLNIFTPVGVPVGDDVTTDTTAPTVDDSAVVTYSSDDDDSDSDSIRQQRSEKMHIMRLRRYLASSSSPPSALPPVPRSRTYPKERFVPSHPVHSAAPDELTPRSTCSTGPPASAWGSGVSNTSSGSSFNRSWTSGSSSSSWSSAYTYNTSSTSSLQSPGDTPVAQDTRAGGVNETDGHAVDSMDITEKPLSDEVVAGEVENMARSLPRLNLKAVPSFGRAPLSPVSEQAEASTEESEEPSERTASAVVAVTGEKKSEDEVGHSGFDFRSSLLISIPGSSADASSGKGTDNDNTKDTHSISLETKQPGGKSMILEPVQLPWKSDDESPNVPDILYTDTSPSEHLSNIPGSKSSWDEQEPSEFGLSAYVPGDVRPPPLRGVRSRISDEDRAFIRAHLVSMEVLDYVKEERSLVEKIRLEEFITLFRTVLDSMQHVESGEESIQKLEQLNRVLALAVQDGWIISGVPSYTASANDSSETLDEVNVGPMPRELEDLHAEVQAIIAEKRREFPSVVDTEETGDTAETHNLSDMRIATADTTQVVPSIETSGPKVPTTALSNDSSSAHLVPTGLENTFFSTPTLTSTTLVIPSLDTTSTPLSMADDASDAEVIKPTSLRTNYLPTLRRVKSYHNGMEAVPPSSERTRSGLPRLSSLSSLPSSLHDDSYTDPTAQSSNASTEPTQEAFVSKLQSLQLHADRKRQAATLSTPATPVAPENSSLDLPMLRQTRSFDSHFHNNGGSVTSGDAVASTMDRAAMTGKVPSRGCLKFSSTLSKIGYHHLSVKAPAMKKMLDIISTSPCPDISELVDPCCPVHGIAPDTPSSTPVSTLSNTSAVSTPSKGTAFHTPSRTKGTPSPSQAPLPPLPPSSGSGARRTMSRDYTSPTGAVVTATMTSSPPRRERGYSGVSNVSNASSISDTLQCSCTEDTTSIASRPLPGLYRSNTYDGSSTLPSTPSYSSNDATDGTFHTTNMDMVANTTDGQMEGRTSGIQGMSTVKGVDSDVTDSGIHTPSPSQNAPVSLTVNGHNKGVDILSGVSSSSNIASATQLGHDNDVLPSQYPPQSPQSTQSPSHHRSTFLPAPYSQRLYFSRTGVHPIHQPQPVSIRRSVSFNCERPRYHYFNKKSVPDTRLGRVNSLGSEWPDWPTPNAAMDSDNSSNSTDSSSGDDGDSDTGSPVGSNLYTYSDEYLDGNESDDEGDGPISTPIAARNRRVRRSSSYSVMDGAATSRPTEDAPGVEPVRPLTAGPKLSLRVPITHMDRMASLRAETSRMCLSSSDDEECSPGVGSSRGVRGPVPFPQRHRSPMSIRTRSVPRVYPGLGLASIGSLSISAPKSPMSEDSSDYTDCSDCPSDRTQGENSDAYGYDGNNSDFEETLSFGCGGNSGYDESSEDDSSEGDCAPRPSNGVSCKPLTSSSFWELQRRKAAQSAAAYSPKPMSQ